MKPYSSNEFVTLLEQVVHVEDPTKTLEDYASWANASMREDLNEEGRCTRLYALGYYAYKQGDYETAKDNATQALALAKALDLKSYEGRSLLLLASISYQQKDGNQLMVEFPHIKELFASEFDYENLAALYLHTIMLSKDQIFEAHLYEAYAYALKYANLNTTQRSLDFYLQLGLISKTLLKDPMGAIAHFLKAKDLAARAKQGAYEMFAIVEIGKAFALVPRLTLALQYFQQASQHHAYKKAPVSLRFECLAYYVVSLLEAEQFDKATHYLDQLLALPLEDDRYPQMRRAVVDGLRAEYEIRTNGDFKLGLEYLNRTNEVFLERAKEFSVPYYKQILLMRFGDLYYKSKDYTYALHYYKQLLKLSDSMIWHLKDAYERLALTYEALGDYEQSLSMMQKAYESSVKIDELNDLKRYNLNFDQFLANNTALLTSVDDEEEIIKEPYVDPITSLYNESLLDEYISFHNETIYRKSIPMTIIHCDIDFFHNYNEFYGEEEANHLLKTVGKTILYTVNDYATKVVRLRNDEFLILLEKIGHEEALNIASRLLVNMDRLALIHEVSPISEIVSMCMAIATAPSAQLDDYHLLLDQAQNALQSIRNTSTKIISVEVSAR